jgi:hypothetical protein
MRRAARVNGPLLTLLLLVVIERLSRSSYFIPDPGAVSLAAIVYSAASGGVRPALVSAALVLLYTWYAVSTPYVPHQWLHLTDENLRRLLVMLILAPFVALFVGRLRDQRATSRAEEEKR